MVVVCDLGGQFRTTWVVIASYLDSQLETTWVGAVRVDTPRTLELSGTQ